MPRMIDAAYIAARLGRALPKPARLRFAVYRAMRSKLVANGFDSSQADTLALELSNVLRISTTKELAPEMQQHLKAWLETQSDDQIAHAAAQWSDLERAKTKS